MTHTPTTLPVAAPAASAGRGALTALALCMLLSSLGSSVTHAALPALAQAFGASFQAVQWVTLAYLLAVTTLVVSVGRIGDLYGRRRLLLSGIAFFTLGSVLCAGAPALWLLIAARGLQGAGAAVMMALSMALLAAAAPTGRSGQAIGMLGTVSAAGTALGPSLGGLLIALLDWRSIFLVNLPLGLLALLLARRCLPGDPVRSAQAPFDLPGSALLALTLLACTLAMTHPRGALGLPALSLLLCALGAASAFVVVETRARAPLLRLQLFRERTISSGCAMSALTTAVAMTTLIVGPFYLTAALALAPTTVGVVMSIGPLMAALMGVPAGHAVDRLGTRRIAIAGLSAMVAGCVTLATVPVAFGVFGYGVPLALTTAGYASFQAANQTAVMAGAAPDQRGVVAGLLNLARNLGLIIGASAIGTVFACASGAVDLAHAPAAAVASGAHTAFGVAALLATGALLLALATTRHRSRHARHGS